MREAVEDAKPHHSGIESQVGEVPVELQKVEGTYTARLHIRDAALQELRDLPTSADFQVGIHSRYFELRPVLQGDRVVIDFSVVQALLVGAGVIGADQWQDAASHFSSEAGALILHASVEGVSVAIEVDGMLDPISRIHEGDVVSSKQCLREDPVWQFEILVPPSITITLQSRDGILMNASQETQSLPMLFAMRQIAEAWWPHARDIVGHKASHG